jgi:hypothetical protein
MRKSKKATRSIKPIGRNPVIAVRVPAPLHERIVKSANDNDRSMSEEMAALIQRGFDWDLALEAGLLDRGFQRRDGTPHWVKAADVATAPASIGAPALNQDDVLLAAVDAVLKAEGPSALQAAAERLRVVRTGIQKLEAAVNP